MTKQYPINDWEFVDDIEDLIQGLDEQATAFLNRTEPLFELAHTSPKCLDDVL